MISYLWLYDYWMCWDVECCFHLLCGLDMLDMAVPMEGDPTWSHWTHAETDMAEYLEGKTPEWSFRLQFFRPSYRFCWLLLGPWCIFNCTFFFFAASLMTMTMAGISFFSLSFHRTKQTFSLVSRVLCDQVQSLVASNELVKASGKHATKMGHLPFVIRRSAINDHFQKLIMLIHQRRTYNQTFVALAKCQMIRGWWMPVSVPIHYSSPWLAIFAFVPNGSNLETCIIYTNS